MKENMRLSSMQQIPLKSAYLCPDCNCIGNCAERCPVCASHVLLGLAGVLDREVEVEEGMAVAAAKLPLVSALDREMRVDAVSKYAGFRAEAA